MDEPESKVTPEEIIAALRALEDRWDARQAEVKTAMQKMRIGDPNHSHYRGIAEGYKEVLKDLRVLLYEPAEAKADEQVVEVYTAVDRDRALALLERAGLSISDLHAHKDNTFSAVFAPLQVLTVEERIAKLTTMGDVAILDTGRLPNSNKAYIDFAFRSPPL
jgi:hypothetical protein